MKKEIPFVDLKAQYLSIKTDIDTAIGSVISETAFIGGTYVKAFEKQFADLYGVKHCVSCANGTDSLYIIMKMLGIGPGHEVITPANSWISSSETITQTGAKPVFVDIDPLYYSIDERLIEASITPHTKAIMAVHLQGQMVQIDAIKEIADRHHLFLIEDCAQSHFSAFDGQRAGTFGIASSFSFYPGKNLGAYGDAGCILTNDDDLATQCRKYANHGALKKHFHTIEGINSRMDGLQAAILRAKLPYILDWTQKRQNIAQKYTEQLTGIGDLALPQLRPNTEHTFHLYMIRTQHRDSLAAYLLERGIQTAVHYPTALPLLPAYEYLGYGPSDVPVAAAYQNQILSLPIYPELDSEALAYVVANIAGFFDTLGYTR